MSDLPEVLFVCVHNAGRSQMAAGLASAGYQVVTAHDGAQALEQAQETPPDLAIVDLEMPGTNGLDVIRRLKQLFGAAVHIVVMTGYDDEASHAEAFEAGTDDFVVKPTGMSELKRRLAAATRNQRAFVEVRLAHEFVGLGPELARHAPQLLHAARHAAHGFGQVLGPDDDERHHGDERDLGPGEV